MRIKFLTKNDLYLVSGLLLFSLIPILWEWQSFFLSPNQAQIWVNGKLQRTIPLRAGYSEKFQVTGIPGYAVVEMKDGKVRIRTDTSPRQIGVHMGWISEPYQQIVNVPYRILITISGDQKKKNIDVVAQ